MRFPMRFFPVLVLALSLSSARPADDLLTPTFARIDKAAADFKALTTDVKRTSHTDILSENDVESGTMAVKRSKPHELRALVNLTQPDQKQVELNGKTVQVYYPKSNTVQYVNLDKRAAALKDQLLLLGFGGTSADIQSAYRVQAGGPETIDGQKTVRLILTPKDPTALGDITGIELWISDATGMAVQQKFNQRGKDYIIATYSNMKLVPSLPDSAVKLNIPKDAHREPMVR